MLYLIFAYIHSTVSILCLLIVDLLMLLVKLALLLELLCFLSIVIINQGELTVNLVEKLLGIDKGEIKNPTKVITIQSKKLNQPMDFPCIAINSKRFAEIQENSIEMKKGDFKRVDTHKLKTLIINEGCPEIFKNKDIMAHFGVQTPPELIELLLLSGEIEDLYNAISELSGYNKDKEDEDEQELKNSSEGIESAK